MAVIVSDKIGEQLNLFSDREEDNPRVKFLVTHSLGNLIAEKANEVFGEVLGKITWKLLRKIADAGFSNAHLGSLTKRTGCRELRLRFKIYDIRTNINCTKIVLLVGFPIIGDSDVQTNFLKAVLRGAGAGDDPEIFLAQWMIQINLGDRIIEASDHCVPSKIFILEEEVSACFANGAMLVGVDT